ncbi:Germination-specific N-acetylmuramoyl-L-alanine amidase precursor [Sporotomaculum syntrophicum]|uniref:Germination-specific N-acetylmuramoyl-L-alanine amidase n=1 Tax=Sporotomaculum syntrophicum TaxID=182264 RepID=A0A9D2WQE8_9FIRM|nr:N-acetylmuramoyl-L-alanine amidase CwlD [Sporotomaculum syntrophicum]KAF1085188.1 Germination-specific N-acetylmuramoyl-L-alanine amidase precursor [Sporotomaculum syntrophicum]
MLRVIRVRFRYLCLFTVILVLGFFSLRAIYDHMENRRVAALSWSLANKVIVVDPGHGGIDPGSKGPTGAIEEDITLEVARKLATVLSQAGAIVLMTRESDMDLSEEGGSLLTRKRQDLARRVALANEHDADAFISVHVNSFKSGPTEHGAQTFYQPGSEEGKKLATSIQSELIRLLKNTNRKAKAVDYYTTRNAKMPAVIVEIGFISNAKEEKLMGDVDYQGKLAYVIYSGMVKYFAGHATPTSGAVDKEKATETFMQNKGEIYNAP